MLSRWLGTELSDRVTSVKLLSIKRGKLYDSTKITFPNQESLRRDQVVALDKIVAEGKDPSALTRSLRLRQNREKMLLTHEGRVWVPSDTTQLSLLVLAHQGMAGHRATKATQTELKKNGFWWPSMASNVKEFTSACLHCLDVCLGERVPRPYGEQIHGTNPYEVLHFDYMYVGESDEGFTCLFICHDDFSGQVTLVPSYAATPIVAATTLMQLFSKFGVARMWVSDGGNHFQNAVWEEFAHLVGADHHIVVAYSPWANGPSERMVKETLRILRSLCSEHRQPFKQWPALVPVAELALNTVVSPLRGKSAIEIVTGREDTHPLSVVLQPRGQKLNAQPIDILKVHRYVENLRLLLGASHAQVSKKIKAQRERKREEASKGAIPAFAPGMFVKVAEIERPSRRKLRMLWSGPYRLVTSINPYVLIIEHLVTKERFETHVSRIEWYADATMEVSEELHRQILYQQQGNFEVKSIKGVQMRPDGHYLVLVHWRGFSSAWDSWKNLDEIAKDTPEIVFEYLTSQKYRTCAASPTVWPRL